MNRMNEQHLTLLDSSIELEQSICQVWLSQSRSISLSLSMLEQAPVNATEAFLLTIKGLSVNFRLLLAFRSELMFNPRRTWAIRLSRSYEPILDKLLQLHQAVQQTNAAMQTCAQRMLNLITELVKIDHAESYTADKESMWELYSCMLQRCEDMLHHGFHSSWWVSSLFPEEWEDHPYATLSWRESDPLRQMELLTAIRMLDSSITRLRYSLQLPSHSLTRMLTQIRQLGESLTSPVHLVKQRVSVDPAAPWYNLQIGKKKRRKR